jgi:hypothetical protein
LSDFGLKEKQMRIVWSCIVVCILALQGVGQSLQPKYEAGTITDVTPHQAASCAGSSVCNYDVSVRVADTVYVVLYTTTSGSAVRFYKGLGIPVLIGKDTIKFRNLLGTERELPILQRKLVAAPNQP